jgi:hypothetical protein
MRVSLVLCWLWASQKNERLPVKSFGTQKTRPVVRLGRAQGKRNDGSLAGWVTRSTMAGRAYCRVNHADTQMGLMRARVEMV